VTVLTRALRRSCLLLAPMIALSCDQPPTVHPVSRQTATNAADVPLPTPIDEPASDRTSMMLQPWTGDLDGMVERRFVRVLVTFNRTNYFLDKADQRGLTYEAGLLFEAFLNQRLGSKTVKVKVVFTPVRRDRLFQALAEGLGDIAAANLTVTPAREKLAVFANPMITDVRELVVLAPGEKPVATVDDLAGREVHVRRSSSYYESLTAQNTALAAHRKPPVRIVAADEQLEDDDLLEMVNAGLMPATVVDSHVANVWRQVFTALQVQDEVALRTGGTVSWALRPGSPKLLEAVNAFVAANPPGSFARNMLRKKYFQNTKWLKNAKSEADLARFKGTIEIFKRYGDAYDFPWLLLAAQAYQESRIDQSVVSPAGAVGMMQIKPSTAEGSPVFIKGVDTSAERNVEAGAKYLRFIADQLRTDPSMDKINRGLFAFASYNAGPARIARLRRQAEQRGLNPNLWFGNVEIVAARDIGAETVDYVSNIYKYYVSYTLIQQETEARVRARGRRATP
jgi:membrane-bound lytic murein transglycosylase MltF